MPGDQIASTIGRQPISHMRKTRKQLSCEPCKRSKLRCNRRKPCDTCVRRACKERCQYQHTANSEGAVHSQPRSNAPSFSSIGDLSSSLTPPNLSQSASRTATISTNNCNELPETVKQWDAVLQRPISGQAESFIAFKQTTFPFQLQSENLSSNPLDMFPPISCCEYLISTFFTHVSPLFPICNARVFQNNFLLFKNYPERTRPSWLALLSVMCSLALLTESVDQALLLELWPTCNTLDLAAHSLSLRKTTKLLLSQADFLVYHDLDTLQALLILLYSICHTEGVERSWALLGTALNIGIALQCHTADVSGESADREQRRLCWAGILMLHTYQAILYRDMDLSYLLKAPQVELVSSSDNARAAENLGQSSDKLSLPQLMTFKLRLFRLSSQLCCDMSDTSILDVSVLKKLDDSITYEQNQWDSAYLVNGMPTIIEYATYAHWCILQTYAHQLRLLLHRPFHHSRSTKFREDSRAACIKSSSALLDLHRQFCESARLRSYRWLVSGMTSFNALHGAIALTSCLLDALPMPERDSLIYAIEKATDRIANLKDTSLVCTRAYPIMARLRRQFEHSHALQPTREFGLGDFDDWIEGIDWFEPINFVDD